MRKSESGCAMDHAACGDTEAAPAPNRAGDGGSAPLQPTGRVRIGLGFLRFRRNQCARRRGLYSSRSSAGAYNHARDKAV